MRGALIHGVLLAVMLVYGYRTWTRDTTQKPDIGTVVLWNKSEADLVSLEWKTERKIVRIERRTGAEGAYWWGLDTTIEKKLKPVEKPAETSTGSGSGSGSGAGSGAGSAADGVASAGSGSGEGSAAPPPAPVEEETRKTREFPLGDSGEKLVENYLSARALRDLGTPDDAAKKDYKLDDAKTTLTVQFKDGTRTFLVGGTVYGGSDRYVLDQTSGKAYVLSRELISGLEVGQSSLHLTDPRGFPAAKIGSVTIEADGKTKTAVRVTTTSDGGAQVKTWADAATKKPNQTLSNFIDNVNNLRPTEYSPATKLDGQKPVMTVTYKDERGVELGTLSLYKLEKPGTLPESQQLDPANPPKPVTEYYIVTPRTRVPALVRSDTGQRTEQDVPTVFSDKEVDSIDPKGNPFGNVPATPPRAPSPHAAPGGHGADDGHGHGAPAPSQGSPAPADKPAGAP